MEAPRTQTDVQAGGPDQPCLGPQLDGRTRASSMAMITGTLHQYEKPEKRLRKSVSFDDSHLFQGFPSTVTAPSDLDDISTNTNVGPSTSSMSVVNVGPDSVDDSMVEADFFCAGDADGVEVWGSSTGLPAHRDPHPVSDRNPNPPHPSSARDTEAPIAPLLFRSLALAAWQV